MLRHIPLGGMYNLRDLGGYPVPNGGETAWERILRGDNPENLTEEDFQWLLERDITTVVDLRSEAEVGYRPDQLSGVQGFCYLNCPLLETDRMPNLENDVGAGYFRVLEGRCRMVKALRAVAAAPGGVLFHCTAGKDRTGLMSALLLGLAGVGRVEILADYQVSEIYLADVIRQIKTKVPDLSAFAGASKAEYLDDCLKLVETKYGSIYGYLQAIGLTEEELIALRRKLLPADGTEGGLFLG